MPNRCGPSYLIAALVLLLSLETTAEPFEREKLPRELEGWADWVLHDVPDRNCPVVEGAAICFWPGVLSLALDDSGGRFTEEVHSDRDGLFPLPGGTGHWPEAVTVDGRPAAVIGQDGRPAVALPAGAHEISGRFVWTVLPEGIGIPPETAMVSLAVNGVPIPFPRRDEGGRLWLAGAAADEEGEKITLSVMRKVRDAVPLVVETRILIRASGKAREVSLGQVLLADTVPIAVASELPARLDQQGTLSLQVRAGTFAVTVTARTKGSPETLVPRFLPSPWPAEEIWVWQADESLRQVTLSGPPGIDPSRTDLPEEWRALPAFLMGDKATLAITTTRRGEPEPPPDDLSLDRTLWMDLDGNGYTVRDVLGGTLNRSWRLDLRSGTLGHVAVDGEDQLITEGAGGFSGVELRNGKLAMTAEWRLENKTRELPAVGWSREVQRLSATLNLPPGWTLITAGGVDGVHGTWWDQWNLFGFFFVLVVSLAIGRLTRWPYGVVAFVALTLSYHEADAPIAVWVSLLITLGLLRVLPKGKLRFANTLLWWLSVVWLAAVLVPFSVTEVRGGLFPQVMPPSGDDYGVMSEPKMEMPRSAAPEWLEDSISKGGERRYAGKKDVAKQEVQVLQQDPRAVVQTGPGVPSWRWNSWRLDWSGPVRQDHQIRLYLVSPKLNLLLSLLRVLLLVTIALRVSYEGWRLGGGRMPPSGGGKATTVVSALGLSLLVAAPAAAEEPAEAIAQEATEPIPAIPAATVLDTLRARLTAPPDCRPDCVSLSLLGVSVSDNGLVLDAEVHAAARAAVTLPGPARNWVPESIQVDGRSSTAVVLGVDGFLRVRLEAGVHRVVAKGPTPPGGAIALELPEPPKRATASAEGWTVDGIRDDGRTESSIQLTRTADASTGDEGFEPGVYPPWLEVTRTLSLGIPWLVHTTVRRTSPLGTPVFANVPLLPGESVTESDLQVTDGAVVVSLGRDDDTVTWSSTMKTTPRIDLRAPAGVPWSEVWEVACSPVFACAFDGITPIQRKSGDILKPTYRPWPGEKLTLAITRPPGIQGQSTTIDAATLSLSPGKRLVRGTLALTVRTSRGGEQGVSLPKGAEVQTVTVDNVKQPFRRKGDGVTLTLKPGTQNVAVTWQQEGGMSVRYRVPEISVGGRAANVAVKVELPDDRWLILTGGPSWGPAVLFWGFLVTVLLAGLILGRLRSSPLKSWQWMLLALGLTQVPIPVALIIVGWFLAMGRRAARPPHHYVFYNTLQICLGLFTLAALGCLVGAVYSGLAVRPDMQVAGADSTNSALRWYVDRIDGSLPTPWVLSLPLIVWKIIMLLWALWLAGSIVKWAPWAWRAFSDGGLWRHRPKSETGDAGGDARDPAPSP